MTTLACDIAVNVNDQQTEGGDQVNEMDAQVVVGENAHALTDQRVLDWLEGLEPGLSGNIVVARAQTELFASETRAIALKRLYRVRDTSAFHRHASASRLRWQRQVRPPFTN